MNKQEKLFYLIDKIDEARKMTPSGKPVRIHPTDDSDDQISSEELEYLFEKLGKDEQVIKVIQESYPYVLDPATRKPFPYLLEIMKRFDGYIKYIHRNSAYQQFIDKSKKEEGQEFKLGTHDIKFDEGEGSIEIGGKKCFLPPFKNEHYFCQIMFKQKVRKPVDWLEIYERMTGNDENYQETLTREHWRSVYDTMIRINNRIKESFNTKDSLFTWQEKTVKRNF